VTASAAGANDALQAQQYPVYKSQSPVLCLQCFDAVGWAAGRASGLLKTEW